MAWIKRTTGSKGHQCDTPKVILDGEGIALGDLFECDGCEQVYVLKSFGFHENSVPRYYHLSWEKVW